MAGSPLTTGVLVPDGLSIHYGGGIGVQGNPVYTENSMAQSSNVARWTDSLSDSSLPSSHELQVPSWFCVESIEHILDILFNTSQLLHVYLGEQFINNPTLSDVTFLIEGKRFYAHMICLHASSDAFRAMFDGGYRIHTHRISKCQFGCGTGSSKSYRSISFGWA